MELMDLLGVGRETAITRRELCMKMGLSDRMVRREIERARNEGVLIVNAQDGEGYYISEDVVELRRQYQANFHRAMSILRQQKHLRMKIEEAERKDQLNLFPEGGDGSV